MPFKHPKLAALAAEARHRRALRAGYFVLKVQRPIGPEKAGLLYSNEDESICTLLPWDDAVVTLMGAAYKMHVYAKYAPDPADSTKQVFEITGGEFPPPQDW